jgi:bifunctional non-homologous end joining protein LigD
MVWDRGHWLSESDPHRGLAKGHLAFTLEGKKLHGGWHLVRMRRRPGEKRDNWLLIKQDDDAGRSPKDADILEEKPLSAASGRSMEQIAKGSRKVWHSNRSAATTKKNTPRARTKKKDPDFAAGRSALPAFVSPCLASLSDSPPDHGNWVHELKFDGYRIQARLDHGKATLLTRKGLDWTKKFPTIAKAIAQLPAKTALVDGELVAEGDDGISSFSLLQQDLKNDRHDRMIFYAFDLLHLDGTNLADLPLNRRKDALARLLHRQSDPLRFSESLTEPGATLLRHACKLGLEGIVSKIADAPYRPGRGHDWIKIKCSDRQELVVAGVVPSTADSRAVGALVLGFYEGGKLHYAGRTGTGFTHDAARKLFRKLMTLKSDEVPFEAVPAEERGARKPIWVRPAMVVEVDFRGWTHGDRVRQASFQGVREDKLAKEVVRERAIAAASRALAIKRSVSAKNDMAAGVHLTHPDRVYWADAGVTKRDLAEYYVKVWKWMCPHVTGRPIALLRCPEGIHGQCFFQKHARAGIPVEHLHLVPEKGDEIIAVDDLNGVIALVQGGVLEIHTRGATIGDRERADRLVFDLDPGPGTSWDDVVDAARDVRARLSKLKLTSFLKTSGGKGLHVVLPIRPTPWHEAKTFAQNIAASMAADSPDRYIATATKSGRSKRIFVDFLRNSREATAVAPYSTRARPGAPVSVPIDWSELSGLKSASQYTVLNLMQRLSRQRKDPWAGIARIKQALPKLTARMK